MEDSAKYTESADIFSLGVMCYQIVKGSQVKIPVQVDKLMDQIMVDEELSKNTFLDYLLLQLNKDKKKRSDPSELLKHKFFASDGGYHEAMKALREDASNIHAKFKLQRMEIQMKQIRYELDVVGEEKNVLKEENDRLKSEVKNLTGRLSRVRDEAKTQQGDGTIATNQSFKEAPT